MTLDEYLLYTEPGVGEQILVYAFTSLAVVMAAIIMILLIVWGVKAVLYSFKAPIPKPGRWGDS